MFLLTFIFLARICNRMRNVDGFISFVPTRYIPNSISIQYVMLGNEVPKNIVSGFLEARRIAEKLDIISIA
ncbi:MAG: hypothetical protein QXU18_09075 [Thermoplasmatales archaeon]